MAGQHRAGIREQESVVDAAGEVGERPTDSEAMTLNSDFAAGVKKRMLRSLSRNSVATSVLFRMFCRSLEVCAAVRASPEAGC